ncbi:hypothetical protein [Nocardioides bruguierae]|uniref:Uncharacterized protein n=1 Tax=Nocardioides bruguierae TaxID=2945102 RepID=A0A9X2DBM2_9ACTN|nr:hypothetical protein [Nocardioides bruguierae]MCM0622848.1 hypothetical protein [Nocardioides bruguierae]
MPMPLRPQADPAPDDAVTAAAARMRAYLGIRTLPKPDTEASASNTEKTDQWTRGPRLSS